jgi:hypothetical protein
MRQTTEQYLPLSSLAAPQEQSSTRNSKPQSTLSGKKHSLKHGTSQSIDRKPVPLKQSIMQIINVAPQTTKANQIPFQSFESEPQP